ncbi:DUF1680-domain-containing protein [Marasmius fiardii PR-910]|nr:DUF1680-domain-containing protein [Marasmius fiardii PR-910]
MGPSVERSFRRAQRWVVKPVQGDLGSGGKLPLAPVKYKPLSLGAIKPTPDSWLYAQLKSQVDGLHGHLQDFWPAVKTSNWIGGNDDYSDLNEAGSYWLNGVVSAAFQLEDQRLLDSVNAWVDYILTHQGADGWLGPTSPDGTRVLWGRYPATLALMSYAQANSTGAPRVVDGLQKFFTGMNDMLKNGGSGLEQWGIMRWYEPGIAIHWLLENHPNGQEAMYESLLKLMRYGGMNWKSYFTDANFPKNAINAVDIKGHGVNVGQAIKSEAIAYRYSHDTSDIDSTRQRVDLIEKYHGSVSGVLKADEHLAGLHPSRGSELCTVVESMHSYEYIYSVIGDNAFADKAERLAFNALPGTFIEDMWAHQYLQQSNQLWAKSMDPRVFATDGPDSAIYGLAPNYPCCTVNHGQGWPKFISHAYMVSADSSTLHHLLLSPTTVTTTLSDNNTVTVSAKTNYPFNSRIDYTTASDKPFNFGIRVPTWVQGTVTYSVDGGNSQNGSPDSNGYIVVNVGGGNHTITATIPMSVTTEETFNGARAVLRGPLVYSVDLGYDPQVLKSYELNSKDYQLDPTSAWQVAIDPSTLRYNGDANSTNLAQLGAGNVFASSGAPVSISVNVCPISWNVVTNAADAPPTSPAVCTGAETGVKLVPYGAAKLRISEMPSYNTGTSGSGSGSGDGSQGSDSRNTAVSARSRSFGVVTVSVLGLVLALI